MDTLAPLLQTLLWVLLIAAVLGRFHRQIHDLPTALTKRIETGSPVKAGPFELGEQLKPQTPAQQRAKVERELDELLLEKPPGATATKPASTQSTRADLQAKYLLTEDLALRAVQDQYAVPVSRKITLPGDVEFDGYFEVAGRPHFVEVWHVARQVVAERVRSNLERRVSEIARTGAAEPRLVWACVFDRTIDVLAGWERFSDLAKASPVPVAVHCYSMSELRSKYAPGLEDEG